MVDIKTKHVRIKDLRQQDLPAFHALCSDERVSAYMRFDQTKTLAESKQVFDMYMDNALPCAIWEEDTLIGIFSLKQDTQKDFYDISVFSHPCTWGKGYFSEVLAAMMIYAKDMMHAKGLFGYILEKNIASLHVAEKLGFQHIRSFSPDEEGLVLRVYEHVF